MYLSPFLVGHAGKKTFSFFIITKLGIQGYSDSKCDYRSSYLQGKNDRALSIVSILTGYGFCGVLCKGLIRILTPCFCIFILPIVRKHMMPMHMDFPSDHPVEEVGRHLLAVLLKHHALTETAVKMIQVTKELFERKNQLFLSLHHLLLISLLSVSTTDSRRISQNSPKVKVSNEKKTVELSVKERSKLCLKSL